MGERIATKKCCVQLVNLCRGNSRQLTGFSVESLQGAFKLPANIFRSGTALNGANHFVHGQRGQVTDEFGLHRRGRVGEWMELIWFVMGSRGLGLGTGMLGLRPAVTGGVGQMLFLCCAGRCAPGPASFMRCWHAFVLRQSENAPRTRKRCRPATTRLGNRPARRV